MNGFGKMRKAAKMTQQAASDASGVPLSTLRKWEQGVKNRLNAKSPSPPEGGEGSFQLIPTLAVW